MATDTLQILGSEYTGVTGIKATDDNNTTKTYIRPQGTKSISANGTGIDVSAYALADVSVSGSSPNLQAKTNINPTTSSQTITADNGYDGLSSVQINAMPSMTLPTAASASSSGTSKATISRSTSNQYINIPTGYNASAAYYTISATANMTLPTAASSTSSGTSKATITPGASAQYLNIPTGYNGTAQYYTIAAASGGSASIDTKTVTASNRPSSLDFTSMKGEPKAFFLKATFTMTSSSSTYYYVDSMRYNGTNTQGRLFQMGSTRQTVHVTSGYSWTYSGTTLTVSSTGTRTASPGCFYNGSYELVYIY